MVSAGILDAHVAGSLGTGDVNVASGATNQLDTSTSMSSTARLLLNGSSPSVTLAAGINQTVAGLSFDGGVTFQASGTWGSSGKTHNDAVRFGGTGTLTVSSPIALTVTAAANTKTYDGTTSAAATPTHTGTLTVGDTATYTETYTTKDVGAGNKTLTPSVTITNSGGQNVTASYSITLNNYTTGTINAKLLTAVGTLVFPASKVYDGGTTATPTTGAAALQTAENAGTGTAGDGIPYTGNGDAVTLTGTASYNYNTKDVATASTITESGLSLTGTGSGNYKLTPPTSSATITKATPTISSVTGSQSIGYGTASVTLSGTVSATGPVYPANGETVSVTINGSTQTPIISGGTFSVSFPTATIPPSPTAYTITYAYAGNTNYNAAANNTGTTLTVTGISVPNLSYTPATGTGLRILISDITSNAGTHSSQASPAYAITGVSASSTAGGTVVNNSTTILYTSPNNTITSDTFTYTLSDGTASATATVTVNFVSPTGPTLSITLNGSSNPVIKFYGILGQSYHIQRAPTPTGVWADVQAVTIPSTGDGSFTWTDTGVTGSANYYRLRYP
jgi:hypothetical protein